MSFAVPTTLASTVAAEPSPDRIRWLSGLPGIRARAG